MENPGIRSFIDELKSKGVTLRLCWAAKRDPSYKYDDVYFYTLHCEERLKHMTLIILDYHYQGGGYGTFVDSGSNDIQATVDQLAERETDHDYP